MTTITDDLKLLTIQEVKAKTGISRPTLYQRIKAGTFPRPRTLGPRSQRWISSEVDTWILNQPYVSGGVYGNLDAESQTE